MQKIGVEKILGEAIDYWKAVMRYNLLFSVLYFFLYLVLVYGVANYTGAMQKFSSLYPITDPQIYLERMKTLMQTEEMMFFSLLVTICSGLVYPLHIGFFKIFKKIDDKEEPMFADLLEGFQGINFIKYAAYYIFWVMIYNSFKGLTGTYFFLFFIPIFWVMMTLCVPPLMYFRGVPLGISLMWSFQVMRKNFLLMFLVVMASVVISYLGLFLFLVGYALTFPFWNAMIYTLYKNIFAQEKEN